MSSVEEKAGTWTSGASGGVGGAFPRGSRVSDALKKFVMRFIECSAPSKNVLLGLCNLGCLEDMLPAKILRLSV